MRATYVVESAWGAVPGLLLVRFPRPLSEPAVPVRTPRRARRVPDRTVIGGQ